MTARARKIIKNALSLTEHEQEDVVRELLAQLESDGSTPEEVEAAWAKEIKRRLDEIDSGTAKMIPGEQVLRELRKRRNAFRKIRATRRGAGRDGRSRRLVRAR